MKNCLYLFVALLLVDTACFAQPEINWDKTLGGAGQDEAYSLLITSANDLIVSGISTSNTSSYKSENARGYVDYWIIKLAPDGSRIWDRTFGGSGVDQLRSTAFTSDGGMLLGGYSSSGASFDKSENNKGGYDYWVIKTDANGNKLWDRTYGGSSLDYLTVVSTTFDNGILLGGYSNSPLSSDKSGASKGGFDFWIVKLDANGNKLWDKTFGGSSDDYLNSVAATPDGGFILGGSSTSNATGDKSENNKGEYDYWIVKTDSLGNKLWDKSFGGSANDDLKIIRISETGELILAGTSSSNASDDKSEDHIGYGDYWVIKTDSNGNRIWDNTLGGIYIEGLNAASLYPDGSILVGGISDSNAGGDKFENNRGSDPASYDYWIVKISPSGEKIWDKTLGGDYYDILFATAISMDREAVMAGYSLSNVSGEKSEPGLGNRDYWVIKLATEIIPEDESDTIPPAFSNIPDDIVTYTDPGICGSVITWTPPTVTDNGEIISLVSSQKPGELFPVGETIVTYKAQDDGGNFSEATFKVTVIDRDPLIKEAVLSENSIQVGDQVSLEMIVDDNNITKVDIYWAVGNPEALLVHDNKIHGSHIYDYPGFFTIYVDLADVCSKRTFGQRVTEISVQKSDNASVAGFGSFYSKPGNYFSNPNIDGPAFFGFYAKNEMLLDNTRLLTGSFNFQFPEARVHFRSTDVKLAYISENEAIFKGEGRLNQRQGYEFTVISADKNPDRIRIQIKDTQTEDIVYDTQSGPADLNNSPDVPVFGFINMKIDPPVYHHPGGFCYGPYPNPFSDHFKIHYRNNDSGPVRIHVFDMRGRLIHSQEFQPDGSEDYAIDLSDQQLSDGIYFVKINQGRKWTSYKVFKKRQGGW